MVYHNPKSMDEALKLLDSLERQNVMILAGGTDLVPRMNSRPEKSGYFHKPLMDMEKFHLVYLGETGLNYICEEEEQIKIGAMVTMSEILESETMDKIPVLKEALSIMAGLTIRNTATIGGNIMNASPAADSVPALLVMDAKVVLASVNGERVIGLNELFAAPGKTHIMDNELLKEILIPVKEGKATFTKFGRRKAESLSVVNGAVYVEMDGAICKDVKIALGAVAPTPLRMEKVETLLKGKEMTENMIKEAADLAVNSVNPIDDKRASGDYRKKLVRVLVERALTDLCK